MVECGESWVSGNGWWGLVVVNYAVGVHNQLVSGKVINKHGQRWLRTIYHMWENDNKYNNQQNWYSISAHQILYRTPEFLPWIHGRNWDSTKPQLVIGRNRSRRRGHSCTAQRRSPGPIRSFYAALDPRFPQILHTKTWWHPGWLLGTAKKKLKNTPGIPRASWWLGGSAPRWGKQFNQVDKIVGYTCIIWLNYW